MDKKGVDDAIQRVKESERVGLPARLAPELPLLESAAKGRLVTWTQIAEKLGVSLSYLGRARRNAKRLYADLEAEKPAETAVETTAEKQVEKAVEPAAERPVEEKQENDNPNSLINRLNSRLNK